MMWFLIAAALLVAYANGANDNFKGVATLHGSRVATYRKALLWATAMTFLGSLTALVAAQGLARAFSGHGLVPAELTASPAFLVHVGLGAAGAVLLATWLGFPISTTHALLGGLLGAGLAGADNAINVRLLTATFLLPLLASPFLAAAITAPLYLAMSAVRRWMRITKEMCLCAGQESTPVFVPLGSTVAAMAGTGMRTISVAVGRNEECVERYTGISYGVNVGQALDGLHYLSAGAVSFARGLNDTPKIAGLLILLPALGSSGWGIILVAVAIAAGGWLSSRKVAHTMSERITGMNHGQGFLANAVTASMVLAASCFGLPVSTTHVSCGTLFGLGAANGQARWGMIGRIFLSWLITVPVAALLAATLAVLV